jgi:hypothetical protein
VVVLIDEYDKPIIEHLNSPAVAKVNRAELRNFYGVLKAADAHLRFVFLTGVSKFTRTSIFSQLNNLMDISLMASYATICGITAAEFDDLFTEHVAAVAEDWRSRGAPVGDAAALRELLFTWYDGFS